MHTGLDRLLCDEARLSRLKKTRVALLANPASMTSVHSGFEHALDALVAKLGKAVTAAFGPLHGMRGDKQYNMEESATYRDDRHGIPVFSLLFGAAERSQLDHIAQLTGGRVFDARKNLAGAFKEIRGYQ